MDKKNKNKQNPYNKVTSWSILFHTCPVLSRFHFLLEEYTINENKHFPSHKRRSLNWHKLIPW